MRTIKLQHWLLIIPLLSLLCVNGIKAQQQEADELYTISGVIKDVKTKRALEYVNISVSGTSIGTVSNSDGAFSLKLKQADSTKEIVFSHVGYKNVSFKNTEKDAINKTFFMEPLLNSLDEIIVRAQDPKVLIYEAIDRIEQNYSDKNERHTGFYRETIKKRNRYINISEAIIHANKSAYNKHLSNDRVQIYKGRKIISQRQKDTLAIKLVGGPTQSVQLDFVKNEQMFLNQEELGYYSFKYEEPVSIAGRLQYVISFEPMAIIDYALFYGKLFIDRETLTFTRAEFSVDMRDKNKATQFILLKKPLGLYFKPIEIKFFVNFKLENNKAYLSYIHNTIQFKCEWEKRWFNATYTINSEVVMTDRIESSDKITYKDSFKQKQSLTDEVKGFYDPDFWEEYNIIEPTESLEKAIDKLKKN